MDKSVEEGPRIAMVLVPLKGRPSDTEVLRQAALVCKRNKAVLVAVYVIVVKQQLALDAPMNDEMSSGEQVLAEATNIASKYGVSVETSILQARSAGVAIVEEAVERNADMIMMGVTFRDRFGEFNMGKTVPYVLRNAPCRVWTFRAELKQTEANQTQS